MEEIEIKFPVTDITTITQKLSKLGFRITVFRHSEKNYLFDDAAGKLRNAGKMLRVRDTPSRKTVTFKGPVSGDSKLKHREEIECRIESAETMIRILEEVGLRIRAGYSKYRTVFEDGKFNVSLDETEAGNYLEVEGPSDEEIIRLGEELGYSEEDFVRRSYQELISAGKRKGSPDSERRRNMTNEKDLPENGPLEMVAVAGPAEAQMIEEILDNNGIGCTLQGDVVSTLWPTVSDLDEVRVFVNRGDRARADELVEAFFTPVAKDELTEGEAGLGVDDADEPGGLKI